MTDKISRSRSNSFDKSNEKEPKKKFKIYDVSNDLETEKSEKEHDIYLTSEASSSHSIDSTYNNIKTMDDYLKGHGGLYEITKIPRDNEIKTDEYSASEVMKSIDTTSEQFFPSIKLDNHSPKRLEQALQDKRRELQEQITNAQDIDEDYGLPENVFLKLQRKIVQAKDLVQDERYNTTIQNITKYENYKDEKTIKAIIQLKEEVQQYINQLEQTNNELKELYEKSLMGEFSEDDENNVINKHDKGKEVDYKNFSMNNHLDTVIYRPQDFKTSTLKIEIDNLNVVLKLAIETSYMEHSLSQYEKLKKSINQAKSLIQEKDNRLETMSTIQENIDLMGDGGNQRALCRLG